VVHGGHLALDTAEGAEVAALVQTVVKDRLSLDTYQALRKAVAAQFHLVADIITTPLQALEHLQHKG